MKVIAASTTIHAPALETSARHRLRYLIFASFSSLYLLPFMCLLRLGTDEGTLVYGAVRIVQGQIFARDFFEVMGPGTFYWLAAFFKAFGIAFMTTRICLFATSLGTGILMYFLSQRACSRYSTLPSILLAGTYFSGIWPGISHHVDSNFFALLSVACIVLWQERRNENLLIGAGVLTGVTTTFHQPKGMLLLVSILLWVSMQRQRRSASMSSLGLILGSYCGVVGLVLAYFASRGALWDLVYANAVWPSGHYGAWNAVYYAKDIVRFYWDPLMITRDGFNWSIGMATILIIPFLYIAALPVLLLISGARSKWGTMRPEIMLYWLCGWALWLSEIHRKDISHLAFGSPLLIILCIHYCEEYQTRAAGLALQILSISAACLASFNFFLVLLTAHPFTTRVGSATVLKSDPVLTFLDERVARGEEIFVYPYRPMYYFLSATTNPTRYSILLYNYNTPSQFQEVIRVLDQHKVRYVLWDASFIASAFPAATPPPGGFIMEPYLESHYKLVWADAGTRLMERKGEDHAN